jgi:hypothetical protein
VSLSAQSHSPSLSASLAASVPAAGPEMDAASPDCCWRCCRLRRTSVCACAEDFGGWSLGCRAAAGGGTIPIPRARCSGWRAEVWASEGIAEERIERTWSV